MLPSMHRVTDPASFRRTTRRGERAASRTLVVHHVAAPRCESADADADLVAPPRVGFVVSKAVGNAVRRNRVKRRLRHLIGERLSELGAGSLTVVRALPGAADASAAELHTDLDRCLGRLASR